jgi:hypothetical protein
MIAAALALAGPASAADSWSRAAGGPQWVKANVCAPGQVGVRASLPGDGGGGSMAARFTLQWLNPKTGAWEPVRGAPSSHWVDAGSADVNWTQVGYTFALDPVPAGVSFQLRGLAELKLAGGRSATLTSGTCTLAG